MPLGAFACPRMRGRRTNKYCFDASRCCMHVAVMPCLRTPRAAAFVHGDWALHERETFRRRRRIHRTRTRERGIEGGYLAHAWHAGVRMSSTARAQQVTVHAHSWPTYVKYSTLARSCCRARRKRAGCANSRSRMWMAAESSAGVRSTARVSMVQCVLAVTAIDLGTYPNCVRGARGCRKSGRASHATRACAAARPRDRHKQRSPLVCTYAQRPVRQLCGATAHSRTCSWTRPASPDVPTTSTARR